MPVDWISKESDSNLFADHESNSKTKSPTVGIRQILCSLGGFATKELRKPLRIIQIFFKLSPLGLFLVGSRKG